MRFRDLERSTWLVVGILLLALGLRLYHLDHQNLWLDEALTWWDSQLPTYWLLRRSALNVHPPGVFFLMKFWTSVVGTGPTMLRLPFVLCSLIITGLAYKLTRSMLSTRPALVVALLMALSPYHVYYAQEARMYALATAVTLAAVVCYMNLRRPPRSSLLAGFGFVFFFAAALHIHYFSAFILAAVNLHFLFDHLKRPRKSIERAREKRVWVTLNAGILLCCLPWFIFVIMHPGQGVKQDWREPMALLSGLIEIRDMFLQMTVGYAVYPDLIHAVKNYLTYPDAADAREFLLHQFLIFGLSVPLMFLLFLRGLWRIRQRASEVLFLFFAPLLITLGLMAVTQRQMELSRYLMLASPYFFIILAVGVVSFKTGRRQLVAAAPLLLAMGLTLTTYYRTPTRGSDYRPVANIISQHRQPGDVILLDPFYMDRCLFYYVENPSLRRSTLNTEWSDSISHYLASHPSLPRVWLILDHRSDMFGGDPASLSQLWPTYSVETDVVFPNELSRVRVLLLRAAE